MTYTLILTILHSLHITYSMKRATLWIICGAMYFVFGIIGHGIGSCMCDDTTRIYPWEAKSSVAFATSSGSMVGEGAIPTVTGGVTSAISIALGSKSALVAMAISCGATYFISEPAYTNMAVSRAYAQNIPNPESYGNNKGKLQALLAAVFQTIFGYALPLLLRHAWRQRAMLQNK